MSNRDFYEVLGVSQQASDNEIKRAYRKQAMRWHPDRNQDNPKAEEEFKAVQKAYEVLSDPQTRAAYDRYGHAGIEGGPGGMGGGADFSGAFGDIFSEIFGGGRRGASQAYRGADLKYSLDITLEQAAAGLKTEIRVPSWDDCETCDGTGAKLGTSPVTCSTCHGAGAVRMQQGFFSVQQTCPTCHGSGQEIKEPCTACHGAGQIRRQKTLEVNIPAGIDSGMRIRSSGNGEPGVRGGQPGDLFVEVNIKPHDIFQRDGDDLHCEVTVPFTTAALGGDIQVPTLSGKAEITIPDGTQSGKTFRLRSKGIKGVRSGFPGDLYCHIQVETPVRLTEKQKEILREFEKSLGEGGERHTPQSKSWTDRVKEFFS